MTEVLNNQISNFPNQFQQEALTLVNNLIDLTSSAFYLLDPEMRHRGVALSNMSSEIENEYQRDFKRLDPLAPRKFNNTDDRVVTIDSQIPFELLRETHYYKGFMQPRNHRYVADMFFRYEGEVIAVLSMLRHEAAAPYTEQELSTLRTIQPFLEFSLNSIYLPKRISQRQSLQERYALTKRELDVLELIIAGASNKQLASALHIALATIKTHLLHIFQKTKVSSRAELLSKVLTELKTSD